MTETLHIHPVFEKLRGRDDREQFLNQRSKVLWFTGLSGSGKSTIAQDLERKLLVHGYFPVVLDGDNIRSGINNNLGFSIEDRRENIRRIAEVAKLFLNAGIIVICTFISPTRDIRKYAKSIIGEEDFIEIYVNAPLEICEKRDVKGLYQKARRGENKNFTGIDSPYEVPETPDIVLYTAEMDLEDCTYILLETILPEIRRP